MKLEGAHLLVTGASSGIGRATVLRLAHAGAKVAAVARRKTRLEELAAEAAGGPGGILPVPADVTDPLQLNAAVQQARAAQGELDGAVFAAGLGIFKPFTELSAEDWQRQIDVLLGGTCASVRAVLPAMLARGRGHLVVVSSRFARDGAEQSTAYCAAKFGVKGFLDSLREEVRRKGIKISNIMPGTVATELFDENWKVDFEKVLQPEDVAEMVAAVLCTSGVVEELLLQSLEHPY